jgi:hypothetical protein
MANSHVVRFVANVNSRSGRVDYLQTYFFGLHSSRPVSSLLSVQLMPGDHCPA